MSTVRRWVSNLLVVTGGVVAPPRLVAQQPEAKPDSVPPSLEARLGDLDQQIRLLQRLRELAADSTAAAAKDRVSFTAGAKDGFSIKSADGKYSLKLRGLVQTDARFARVVFLIVDLPQPGAVTVEPPASAVISKRVAAG